MARIECDTNGNAGRERDVAHLDLACGHVFGEETGPEDRPGEGGSVQEALVGLELGV
jgi:hypothetical protein